MSKNESIILNGASNIDDIVEYSIDKRKVSFGMCNFDGFLEEYSIDDAVEIIEIKGCKFSSLNFLSELPHLKEVYIDDYPYENPISMADLRPLKQLRKIGFSNCSIAEIQGLEHMPSLELLLLIFCNISKIQGLETLIGLKELDLSSNQIVEIEGLDNLLTLESLNLSANKIRKIENLENLMNLKNLRLMQNHIRVIEGLNNLKKLELLHLGVNHLFQGVKYISRQELMAYIGHFPNLKSFNTYKFPLPERIYLSHNIEE